MEASGDAELVESGSPQSVVEDVAGSSSQVWREAASEVRELRRGSLTEDEKGML